MVGNHVVTTLIFLVDAGRLKGHCPGQSHEESCGRKSDETVHHLERIWWEVAKEFFYSVFVFGYPLGDGDNGKVSEEITEELV